MGLIPDLKSLEKIIADRLQETNDRLDTVIRLLTILVGEPDPGEHRRPAMTNEATNKIS